MTDDFHQRYIQARRTVIEQDFRHLNPMQRQAALSTEGPLLLLAGAGSGKTTVLINRVANLLRYGRGADSSEVPEQATEADLALLEKAAEGQIPICDEIRRLCAMDLPEPWQILAITFTNKAAGELKSRLDGMLGDRARDIWAMTFHSACVRILRRDAQLLGFPGNFTIYDQADSLAVMKQVIREMNLDDKVWAPKAVLSAASRYKGAMLSPEESVAREEKSGDLRRIRTAQACLRYANRLRESGAMDFDDLLYYCVRLLRENEDVLARYQRQFRYVLIDEYQDTNYLQYLFARLMAGGSRNICVVGDDDQSIYKFRGATIENILNFEKEYANARLIRLEQNYRSTGSILEAANAVISHNTQRKGKTLWTDRGAGDRITLYTARNEEDEADFVARTILQGTAGRGERSRRDYAVLYRTNAQSRTLELALRRRDIPYRIFGGTRFFDRAEVKDVLAYLQVIANPTDETRLLRIVNVPPRGIGQASLEKAREIARQEDKPLFQVLSAASHYPGLTAGRKMEDFCSMITGLQQLLEEAELDEFYDAVLDRTGYLRALEEKNLDENLSRIENVHELKTSILKSMERYEGGDLYSFLDEVALYTDLDNYDQDADAAVLMTMHAAKGLEFPVVFLVGAEENLFPGMLAIGEPEEMEEERRLCYVAITRAKEKLYVTCAARRMLYGRTAFNLPSRFIEEIPEKLVDCQGVKREPSRVPETDRVRRSWDFSETWYPDGGETAWAGSRRAQSGGGSHRRPEAGFAPPRPQPEPDRVDYRCGDRVEHKVFGQGEIQKITPMGGDALVEIAFETAGVKKLMLRVASRNMRKCI